MKGRYWWNRARGQNTSIGTLIQRIFDRFASAIVVKDSPGQPRYFDNDGNALAEEAITGAVAAPTGSTEPNFFGGHYTGKIALWWTATTPADTVDVNVWARSDSVITYDGPEDKPESIVFGGDYILVNTTTGIVDDGEIVIDQVGYRPVFVQVTSANAGTLRIGYV